MKAQSFCRSGLVFNRAIKRFPEHRSSLLEAGGEALQVLLHTVDSLEQPKSPVFPAELDTRDC